MRVMLIFKNSYSLVIQTVVLKSQMAGWLVFALKYFSKNNNRVNETKTGQSVGKQ